MILGETSSEYQLPKSISYNAPGEFSRVLREYMYSRFIAISPLSNTSSSNSSIGLFYNGRELTSSDTAYDLDMAEEDAKYAIGTTPHT